MRKWMLIMVLGGVLAAFAAGCAEMTPAQQGAAGGALAGAAAGGLIGGSRKSTVIGAGMGALGGALLNDEISKTTNEGGS